LKTIILFALIILVIYLTRVYWKRRKKAEYRLVNGYWQVKGRNGIWEYVHRKVAAWKVGGKIWKGREVHHRDGNKRNNRPENLWIMPKPEHQKIHKKNK